MKKCLYVRRVQSAVMRNKCNADSPDFFFQIKTAIDASVWSEQSVVMGNQCICPISIKISFLITNFKTKSLNFWKKKV